VYLNEEELAGLRATDPIFPSLQFDCMVEEYSRIIKEQLARLTGDDRPMDLLVLVPSRRGMERDWAVAALENIGSSFIDYTNKARRRDIAQSDMVRLCTFHSARGIEGRHVLVFRFERIESVAAQVDADFAKLGYIVLSRALFECVIAVRKVKISRVVPFLERILKQLPRSLPEAGGDEPARRRVGHMHNSCDS
jgi:hypothetical protein